MSHGKWNGNVTCKIPQGPSLCCNEGSEVGKDVLFEGFVTDGGVEECLS